MGSAPIQAGAPFQAIGRPATRAPSKVRHPRSRFRESGLSSLEQASSRWSHVAWTVLDKPADMLFMRTGNRAEGHLSMTRDGMLAAGVETKRRRGERNSPRRAIPAGT